MLRKINLWNVRCKKSEHYSTFSVEIAVGSGMKKRKLYPLHKPCVWMKNKPSKKHSTTYTTGISLYSSNESSTAAPKRLPFWILSRRSHNTSLVFETSKIEIEAICCGLRTKRWKIKTPKKLKEIVKDEHIFTYPSPIPATVKYFYPQTI